MHRKKSSDINIQKVRNVYGKKNERTRDGKTEAMIVKNLDEHSWVQITNYTFLSW